MKINDPEFFRRHFRFFALPGLEGIPDIGDLFLPGIDGLPIERVLGGRPLQGNGARERDPGREPENRVESFHEIRAGVEGF
jgi:hypothetical protein